jgi:hypothetical protein
MPLPAVQAASGAVQLPESVSSGRKGPEILYRFKDHLAQAEASLLSGDDKIIFGTWKEDRFIFAEMEDYTHIGVSSYPFNGVEEEGIFFHPVENAKRRLRFYNVPSGSKIVIHYGIDDFGATPPQEATVYFYLWIGKHKLKRIRVPNEKGLRKEIIDLGVLAFLKHSLVVTFEVTSESVEGRRLSFRAEILQ